MFDTDKIRPTRLEVDLNCLAWNIRQIRKATDAGAVICASMKANAYGHGARRVARAALANGADRLSVALLDEAIELRRSNIGAPILILGSLERRRADEVVAYGLAQTISSFAEASELSKTAVQMDKQAAIHIKIDTGMGRLGFVCEKPSVINEIFSSGFLPGLIVEGIYTHFAVSDESDVSYTEWQLKKFNDICADLGRRGLHIPIRHCSNSAAISGYPEAHLNMVRPGIALYGGAGKLPGAHHREIPLRRVMSLRTEVALVKEIPAGASVGYGRRFIAGRTSRIATLPLGYGDGYGRGLSDGKGKVLIGGRRAPTAGIICMDQCMVDVTDAGDVGVGDEAVLFGTQGGEEITLEEISKTLDTIPYELMCAISRRVPRVYMQDGKPESGVNYLNY